ncbi:MAG: hypothetical protein ACJAXM_001020 [Arenicella sp.]|jgi:hypothetical protein
MGQGLSIINVKKQINAVDRLSSIQKRKSTLRAILPRGVRLPFASRIAICCGNFKGGNSSGGATKD